MNLYLVGPITGQSYRGAVDWRNAAAPRLELLGYRVYSPMRGKEHLLRIRKLRPYGYDQPASTDKAIMRRDMADLERADAVLANLLGADRVSIGSMFELAWAYLLRKYVVVVMEKDNLHRHAFVEQAASVVVEGMDEAEGVLAAYIGSV